MSGTKKHNKEKDYSGEIGLGAGTAGAAGAGGTLVALTGGSAAAPAITYALSAIGGVVGGGMAAGLGVIIGGPIALGAGAYAISKAIRKTKRKK
ncbi:MAG: hypothetical protein K2K76_02925 [Muribaculaceae bacterium]|nr:hypothetical protein [Muribaculaceae bacterium]